MANKVTANYINAQGITATSIKVLDDHNNTLFEAGGAPDTDEDGNIILDEKGQPTIKDGVVTVAGWKATKESFVGGDEETGTYTKIQIPNADTNAANSLKPPKDLFELKVLTGKADDTGSTPGSTLLKHYSLVPEEQIKLRKNDESNPLLERDNYYAWDIIPKSDNDAGTSNPPPHLAIIRLKYTNNTPLYNFNIYLSGLFNTVPVNGKETSVNFIAATDIFNEYKLTESGYIDKDGNIDESKLLEILCYTGDSEGKLNPPPSKLNPRYVLTMDNTSLFYTGKVNYVYPQINKGD